MKLIFYEAFKCFTNKYLLWILATVLVLNAALCFFEAKPTGAEYEALLNIAREYEKDPRSVGEYYRELTERRRDFEKLYVAYMRGELDKEPIEEYPFTYSGFRELDDAMMLSRFYALLESSEAFADEIGVLIENAYINRDEVISSYGDLDENSFAYRLQTKMIERYEEVQAMVSPAPHPVCGWDAFFNFGAINIFVFALSALGASYIFMCDRDGAAFVLLASKKGRAPTALAKLFAGALWSALTALGLLGTSLIAVYIRCGGLSPLGDFLATFEDFRLFPYAFKIWEYLLCFVISKLLLAFFVSAAASCACLIFKSMSLGFLSAAAVIGSCYIAFTMGNSQAVRYFNPFGFGALSQLMGEVRCLDLFGFAAETVNAIAVALILSTLLLSAVAVMLFAGCGRVTHRSPLTAKVKKALAVFFAKEYKPLKLRTLSLSIFDHEAHKLFSDRFLCVALVLVLLIGGISSYSRFDKQDGYSQAIYAEYIEKLEGAQTDAKRAYIEEEYNSISETIGKYRQYREEYYGGRIAGEEYSAYLEEYSYASDRIAVIETLQEHSLYLDRIKSESGKEGHYLYDLDWVRLFTAEISPLLIILLILPNIAIYAGEYGKSKMRAIIRSQKRGRLEVWLSKLALSAILSFAVTVLFTVFELIAVLKNFRLPSGDAPLVSLEMFGMSSLDMTITEFLVLVLILRALFLVIFGALCASVGGIITNRLYALAATLMIAFAPRMITSLGVSWFKYADPTKILGFVSAYTSGFSLGGYYLPLMIGAFLTLTAVSVFACGIRCCKGR